MQHTIGIEQSAPSDYEAEVTVTTVEEPRDNDGERDAKTKADYRRHPVNSHCLLEGSQSQPLGSSMRSIETGSGF